MALVESHTQSLDRPAADFDLLGTDNEWYTLKDFIFKKGLFITFTCNHCPYAKASRGPLIELSYQFSDIAFVAINSNDSTTYPEDSFSHMQDFAKRYGLPFHYLHDPSQQVAKAYDAQCTPDNYLFKNIDGNFQLFYQGRINDNRQDPSSVSQKDLEQHMSQLTNNETSSQPWPPSMGCSIKRK